MFVRITYKNSFFYTLLLPLTYRFQSQFHCEIYILKYVPILQIFKINVYSKIIRKQKVFIKVHFFLNPKSYSFPYIII